MGLIATRLTLEVVTVLIIAIFAHKALVAYRKRSFLVCWKPGFIDRNQHHAVCVALVACNYGV